MDALKRKRAIIKGSLTRFWNQIESSNVPTLRARLEQVKDLIDKFNDIQLEIELLDTETLEPVHEAERKEFVDGYFVAVAKAREIIQTADRDSPNLNQISNRTQSLTLEESEHFSNSTYLPKLKIPSFNGSYSNWVKFRDTFISLIDSNPKLSNIQKFAYLNDALDGKAAGVISSLGVSEENYPAAWKKVKERYEDENELIHHHVSGLFNAPRMAKNSADELHQLIDNFENHISALNSLKKPTDQWDTLLIYLLTTKLNSTVKLEWEKQHASRSGKSTMKDMFAFLEAHCKFLSKTSNSTVITENKDGKLNKGSESKNQGSSKSYSVTMKTCVLCSGTHPLYACEEFKALTPQLRFEKIRELKVCFNCLCGGHRNKDCKYGPCKKCGRKHNVLIHLETVTDKFQSQETNGTNKTAPVTNQASNSSAKSFSVRAANHKSDYVLLGTAIVYLYDNAGNAHECRAALDSLSQPHLLTSEFFEKLELPKLAGVPILSGIEQGEKQVLCRTAVKLRSRVSNFSRNITCLVVDQIDNELPSPLLRKSGIEIPKNIELADPHFDQARPIDMLIGAAFFYELLCVGQIKLRDDQPTFQKTVFGWIVSGSMRLPSLSTDERVTCKFVRNNELNDQLEKFWNIENVTSNDLKNDSHLRNDIVERHFCETVRREQNGRFVVNILYNEQKISQLGDSEETAYKRLLSTEKRLARDPNLREQYSKFMQEYEDLGHMTEVTLSENDEKPHYYLPHHPVFKDESTTTKLRVVFDGSAKTSSGVSLNDTQYVGPTVQDDLTSINLRFRHHRYVITGDVNKMYRQVLVDPEQRSLQRILWRTNKDSRVKIYELNTVTQGTAEASFLATRCIAELGHSVNEKKPLVSKVILRDFYIDDLQSGAETIEEARKLKLELSEILNSAGFELRKWASNDPHILDINDQTQSIDIPIHGDKNPKTLGLLWDPSKDVLKYQVRRTDSIRVTKRTILSIIAQIYDPLGLVGPTIIASKVIMQKLWSSKVDWDESLPQDLHYAWLDIYEGLMQINEIVIPRHVVTSNFEKIEYHGFCDASEKAYGACIYVVSICTDGTRYSNLLCAKSRVAPLKTTTIPRLELLGALLLAQLAHKVKVACDLDYDNWHFWTDSMVVLSWIKSQSNKWKIFVTNRVAEIQDLTNDKWEHVETAQNPADLISRGTSASELRDAILWWHGPQWLLDSPENWPLELQKINDELVPEQRTRVLACVQQECKEQDSIQQPVNIEFNDIFTRFSSFSKLVRVTAYIFQFFKNLKRLKNKITEQRGQENKFYVPILTADLQFATNQLLKCAQLEMFNDEIKLLAKGKELSINNQLSKLHPIVDSDGLIRVGGRLENANLSYAKKHPIILKSNHPLTKLIIIYEHERLLHSGCNTVITSLLNRYWILSCKQTVKKILRSCVICFKARPTVPSYLMGHLPAARVTPKRAFDNCGVDYAGPFLIKERGRSRFVTKGYLCIFVCFATKAVHLELATDMTADAFLNCLKRFVSRRGLCSNIYSDNGSNFVGAKNQLKDIGDVLKDRHFQNNVGAFCTTNNINWHMIPPHAPHFGGLWESAVKSAKYHLKRVIGEIKMTYEELYTVFTQIEACMNSRPLSPISNDPKDITPLTPGHFLIGDTLTTLPDEDIRELQWNRLDRYQMQQQMIQNFWHRWQREYLPQLQVRQKWKKSGFRSIKIGDMVLIKEDNTPPMQWPLGRVIEIHPGADGVVRVISIKVARGIIKRPVAKVCILPFEEAKDNITEEHI